MDIHRVVAESTGFDWDEFNIHKNWDKHQVPWWKCEEVFFSEPLLLLEDIKHSEKEIRYYALGKTADKRNLTIVFTIRGHKVRPISARDMSRKERKIYAESQTEADSQV
jgi:uncharacterized DUF497 family protein